MQERPGCLGGLLKLAFIKWIFDFMQDRFGFGKGLSCSGCGCGMILFILFLYFTCSTIFGTDWFRLGF